MRWMLPFAICAVLRAATASDILANVDASLSEAERSEPGSTARPDAIATALEAARSLAPGERLLLRLALAEAWLDADHPEQTAEIIAACLPETQTDSRPRALLAWIGAARAAVRRGDLKAAATILEANAQVCGEAGGAVAAHHAVAAAELILAGLTPGEPVPAAAKSSLELCDHALEFLAAQPASERVPVYLLRLTAMERLGAKGPEVLAWIQARQADPAAAEVAAASAATALGKLIGQPAPPLAGKRLDAAGGTFDLASLKGRPVLLDWFATWCAPCRELAPTVAAFAQAHPTLAVVSVSLDNKDSLAELPRFLAQNAMTWTVIGDGIGWDTEMDDAWHVNAIPSLILVAPDGTVAAADLVGDTPEFTTANLEKALAPLLPKPKAGPVIP